MKKWLIIGLIILTSCNNITCEEASNKYIDCVDKQVKNVSSCIDTINMNESLICANELDKRCNYVYDGIC